MDALTRLFSRIPWFVSAPAVVALAAALAIGTNLLVGPYFERSFLDEADPLASAGAGADGTPTTVGDTATASAPAPSATAGATPEAPSGDAPGVLLQGEWQDGAPGHNGEGVAKIIRTADGALVLRLEEFSVTNGPDLFVVLSTDADGYADDSLSLGGLRATDGNINYDIPPGTDLTRYKSAVVWCRSAHVTFAYAPLEPAP